jgi:SAM-dependent methyltransferase
MDPETAPLPPLDLAARVGPSDDDEYENYLAVGAIARSVILDALPDAWTLEGKRALDFGCGAGRTLRHFLHEAEVAEVWGCDIHAASIDWLEANLCPPLHCFRSDLTPPLPIDEGYFDVIWAMSVFTHLGDEWADWLVEMTRVLAPGGLLVATYLGAGMFEALLDAPYVEDEVGMLVVERETQDDGGPWVFHSEWWLREHWGRAFDVVAVQKPSLRADGSTEASQSLIVVRRGELRPTRDELERVDSGEARELAGLRSNVSVLRRELRAMRAAKTRTGEQASNVAAPRSAPGPTRRLARALGLRSRG